MANTTLQTITRLIQALAFSCLAFASLADEAALYDLAPPGSAFLRIINLQKSKPDEPITVRIQAKRLTAEVYCSASKFIYLPAGAYNQRVAGLRWKGSLQAGKGYSLLLADNNATLLRDYRAENSRRGMLAVYNFSNRSQVSLQTAKSARPVLSNISQMAAAARPINPLKSAFSVVDSTATEEVIAQTEAMIFQPGVLSSLFICNDQSGLFARWADPAGDD